MHVVKKTRKALLNLLQDWKVWSMGGGVGDGLKLNAKDRGLCSLAMIYDAGNMVAHMQPLPPAIYHALKGYLRRDFPTEMATTLLPFNPDLPSYCKEVQTYAAMRNGKRRAWVDKMIEELSREELPADS